MKTEPQVATTTTTSEAPPTPKVNIREEIDTLHRNIGHALREAAGQFIPWIETHPEVLENINRGSLKNQEYMTYMSCIVTTYGNAERLQEEINRPMTERLHGKNEGVIVGR